MFKYGKIIHLFAGLAMWISIWFKMYLKQIQLIMHLIGWFEVAFRFTMLYVFNVYISDSLCPQ